MTNLAPIHQATNCFRNEEGEWFASIRHTSVVQEVEIGDEVCVNGRKGAQWMTTIIAIKERTRDRTDILCGQPPWSPNRETLTMERTATARRTLLDIAETERRNHIRTEAGLCRNCGEFPDDCACKRTALAEAEQQRMNAQADKAREEQNKAQIAEREHIDTALATLTDERWQELTRLHGDDIPSLPHENEQEQAAASAPDAELQITAQSASATERHPNQNPKPRAPEARHESGITTYGRHLETGHCLAGGRRWPCGRRASRKGSPM